MKTIYGIAIFGLAMTAVATVQAGDLVYEPVNPNFGGNPLNGRYLLDGAILQDDNADPNAPTLGPASRFDSFAERLDRAILNQLSRNIVANAFGTGTLQDGTYDTGLSTIVIETTLDSTIITITDNETGEVTIIEVPFF
jgi:curli production assembly/transport component CsgF